MLRPAHAVDTLLLFQVLVCLIDLICPPVPVLVQSKTEAELEKEKEEQEIGDKEPSGDEQVRIINVL
jgi:hypothetical protein